MKNTKKYQFEIEGQIKQSVMEWFCDMEVHMDGSNTILRGDIEDQAALYGIIGRLRDLGLKLVKVETVG